MPLYDVIDLETNEITEMQMSVSAWEEFKKDNPTKQQYFSTLNFTDSVSLGRTKPPIDFKEGVIDRIKRANPLHNMSSRWE